MDGGGPPGVFERLAEPTIRFCFSRWLVYGPWCAQRLHANPHGQITACSGHRGSARHTQRCKGQKAQRIELNRYRPMQKRTAMTDGLDIGPPHGLPTIEPLQITSKEPLSIGTDS